MENSCESTQVKIEANIELKRRISEEGYKAGIGNAKDSHAMSRNVECRLRSNCTIFQDLLKRV